VQEAETHIWWKKSLILFVCELRNSHIIFLQVTTYWSHERKLAVTGASGLLDNRIVELTRRCYTIVPLHNTKPLQSGFLKRGILEAIEVAKLFNRLKPTRLISARAFNSFLIPEKDFNEIMRK
jgi:hypothetical protein